MKGKLSTVNKKMKPEVSKRYTKVMKKVTTKKSVMVKLTQKEAEYLSDLVETQKLKLMILGKEVLAKKPFKDEYKISLKLADALAV